MVLLCIFPVTICTCERSVSTLRRVKTFLRTSTGEDRLSALSVLSVHRDVSLDLTEVVDKFARERDRRANFFARDLILDKAVDSPGAYPGGSYSPNSYPPGERDFFFFF